MPDASQNTSSGVGLLQCWSLQSSTNLHLAYETQSIHQSLILSDYNTGSEGRQATAQVNSNIKLVGKVMAARLPILKSKFTINDGRKAPTDGDLEKGTSRGSTCSMPSLLKQSSRSCNGHCGATKRRQAGPRGIPGHMGCRQHQARSTQSRQANFNHSSSQRKILVRKKGKKFRQVVRQHYVASKSSNK